MVKIHSTSRLLSIKAPVILAQTDTTVGFLSQDELQLREIKERESSKPFIKVFKNFHSLNVRIPNSKKRILRRSKKTTFIVKDVAFRVVQETPDSSLLRNMEWSFSTSANRKGESFHREFCEQKADIIIEDNQSLKEKQSSTLLKMNNKKIKRLR